MSLAALITAIAVYVAAHDTKPAPPVSVRMVAVHAATTGKKPPQFGPGTEEVRAALADLPFDTFTLVKAATQNAPYGSETVIAIDSTYTFHIAPLEKDAAGRFKVHVRVAMTKKSSGRNVSAVSSTVVIAPNTKLKLLGMPMEKGELVVVISLKN